ncbi:hypothetical protein KKA47_04770 [bacterium]|nr:hypothetical protein [bacterium]
MTIKPFHFKNLGKLSKKDIERTRTLMEFLPKTGVREQFHLAIRKMLIKHMGQDVIYFINAVDDMSMAEFCNKLPENPILVVIGLNPLKEKLVVYIDHTLAYLIIDKLLGGLGDVDESLRALTDTEQGVLQYLIMQILSQFQLLSGVAARVNFRMEKFIFSAEEAVKYVPAGDKTCVLNLKVGVSDQAGFVRIVFPDPFTKKAFLENGIDSFKKKPLEHEYAIKQFLKYDHIRTSLWAEAGYSELSPMEIKGLEEGDVVLFDTCRLRIKNGKIEGGVTLRIGSGEAGGIDAKLKPDQLGVIIQNIKRGI